MTRLTVRDLIATKGHRKLVLTTAFDEWTAQACEAAEVDMIVTWGASLGETLATVEKVRAGAPNTLIGSGLPLGDAYSSSEQALRLAGQLRAGGVDIIYCSGLVPRRFEPLCEQQYPCVGHVGYVPVHDTWFGGPRAVGKNWQEAIHVYEHTVALQNAGVIAVEMECVPAAVAAEITRRVDILTFSMGSGGDCDGHFLFSCDLLGTNTGHYPRHSKTYTNFLEQGSEAIRQFRRDVTEGRYPAPQHQIEISTAELDKFQDALQQYDRQ